MFTAFGDETDGDETIWHLKLPLPLIGGTVAVLTLTTAVWWLDGRPGPGWFRRRIGAARRSDPDRSRP